MKHFIRQENPVRFTREGYENAKKEYAELLEQREPAVEHLKKAREMGDLKENGYYTASRFKLSSIDRQLRRLSYSLKQAQIVETSQSNSVDIGSNVTITDGKDEIAYSVVGDTEANPGEGKISLLSPLGRALEKKKEGDKIKIKTPSGEKTYLIVSIKTS